MNQGEFEQLRDLPGKYIAADIIFSPLKDARPNLVFEQIRVENSLGLDVVLNGTYTPGIPTVVFNFVIRGVGPICRLCVNGAIHKKVGRHHKHELTQEEDPRKNLPHDVERQDLVGKTAAEVWQKLCEQANIEHIKGSSQTREERHDIFDLQFHSRFDKRFLSGERL